MVKKVGAILQARMGSSRLPGKILMPLPHGQGIPLIGQILNRAKKADNLHEIIVATSTQNKNDELIPVVQSFGAKVFRGDEDDVLSRFYFAAKENALDVIVRLTGDNPFISSKVIDEIVEFHLLNGSDYSVTKDLPLGTNIEVVNFKSLEKAYNESTAAGDREHVTTYVWKNPQVFKLAEKSYKNIFKGSLPRLTVDFPSDYAMACKIYEDLYDQNPNFDLKDVADLLEKKPWILFINSENQQNKA